MINKTEKLYKAYMRRYKLKLNVRKGNKLVPKTLEQMQEDIQNYEKNKRTKDDSYFFEPLFKISS